MARELFPLGNDDRKSQFASDSLLEGDGFELAVRGHGASGAAHRWRIWVVKADPLSPWRIRFVLTHFTLRIKKCCLDSHIRRRNESLLAPDPRRGTPLQAAANATRRGRR
jgi:hypothetical protein